MRACVDACGASLIACSLIVLVVVVLVVACRLLHVLPAAVWGSEASPELFVARGEDTERRRKAQAWE